MKLADGTFQKLCNHKYVPSIQSYNTDMMREMRDILKKNYMELPELKNIISEKHSWVFFF